MPFGLTKLKLGIQNHSVSSGIAGVVSSSSSNTTVSTNVTVPAVVSTISFKAFANADAFDSTAQTNVNPVGRCEF